MQQNELQNVDISFVLTKPYIENNVVSYEYFDLVVSSSFVVEITYGNVSTDYNNSGIYIVSSSIEIPSFNEFSSLESQDMNRNVPGDYSTYLAEADRSAYNSANPVEGWYYTKVSNQKYGNLLYSGQLICQCMIEAAYYDRFLYVDGNLIDFAEFRPSWDDGVFTTSDVSGGKVYTLECKGSYAGQEVHLKTSVTVTAKK